MEGILAHDPLGTEEADSLYGSYVCLGKPSADSIVWIYILIYIVRYFISSTSIFPI